MGDAGDARRLAAASEEIERLTRSNEFWYLATKAAVRVVVRTAGTDAAEEMLEAVRDDAVADFPTDTSETRVSEEAATLLLEDLRRLASVWEKHGSIGVRGEGHG